LRYQEKNIWLTQKLIAELYDLTVAAVTQHIKRIFDDGELVPDSVIKDTPSSASLYNNRDFHII
jgi:hypothetical protein